MRAVVLLLAVCLSLPVLAANQTMDWMDLMPEDERDRPPADIMRPFDDNPMDPAAEQPPGVVRSELNGKPIRIAGFIVPLEIDPSERVTEYLLVPYFGACVHVPPPPLNQIIHVTQESGIHLDDTYDAVWVSGVLKVSESDFDYFRSGYAMKAESVEQYQIDEQQRD